VAAVAMNLTIRVAERSDVPLIFSFIVELAEYERAPNHVKGDQRLLEEALFGQHPSAEAVIAELDGTPVGFALFHGSFSTWECRPGIWLEDLYVPPEHRRAGVGQALLRHLAAVAVDRGCTRLEWAALAWNAPALDFYETLGATRLDEWRMHRLDGEALARVADPAPGDQ
jgi:GNAT superfamily N-acetyltransferase